MLLGLALSRQNRMNDALKAFRKAARLNPESAQVQYNLALTYYQTGAIRQSRIHYRRAVNLDPAFARAPYDLGAALRSNNQQR